MRIRFNELRIEGTPEMCAQSIVGLELIAEVCGDEIDSWESNGSTRELSNFEHELEEIRAVVQKD